MSHLSSPTQMSKEINEIPDALQRQVDTGLEQYFEAGRKTAALKPKGFVTCARGTSDHAATFFKYVMEINTGLPVASIGPSIASIYDVDLKLEEFVCLTISQSGGSKDLVALQNAARKGGAFSIALLNEVDSPVGRSAELVLPVLAGPEKAVAATKSFVNSLFAILGFVAGFTGDADLKSSLQLFPETAKRALGEDWSVAALGLARASSIFTIGRGPGLAVAAEAALKLKETCRIHAEVYSSAEVLHGPVVLADRKFAALAFQTIDEANSSILNAGRAMRDKGADVFSITPDATACPGTLFAQHTGDPYLLPLVQIIGFYKFVEALAARLGENADAPAGLNKVTVTV